MKSQPANFCRVVALMASGWLAACGTIQAQSDDRADAGAKVAAKSKTNLKLADLFPRDRVLDVQITVDEKDWNTIRYQSGNFFSAFQAKRKYEPIKSPYTYVKAKVVIDGVVFPEVGIRKKGFIGSLSMSRPSLKVKLNFVDKKGQIEGLKNLTFNNNKQDLSLVSQFMGYALFNQAGSPAPRCGYAKVSVNGKSLGVYSHVESVKQPMFQREYGSSKGTLYEGTVVDFFDGWEGSFEHKFGDDEKGRAKIKQLIATLQRDMPEEEVEREIGKLVDIDSFYTFWAIEGLLGFWDGYSGNYNNFFVYWNPKTDKLHFLPWGADSVFQKYSKIGFDRRAPLAVKTKGLVAHKLYQTEGGRKRYARTINKILDEHWQEEKLIAETERIEALLKPYVSDDQKYGYRRALNGVRTFIRKRRDDIQPEISGDMPIWKKAPDPPLIIGVDPGRQNDTVWHAAKTGDLALLEKKLKQGQKLEERGEGGATMLSVAALAGQIKIARELIEKGADVNTRNDNNQTPLHAAALLGRTKMAQLLLAHDADINAKDDDDQTPLDLASSEWNSELKDMITFVRNVLQIKVDSQAAQTGRLEVSELLRKSGGKMGADIATPNRTLKLTVLAKAGDLKRIKQALEAGAKVNQQDAAGVTPLCWAVMADQREAAKMLIEAGADVSAANRDGGTSLHGAAFLGRVEMVELLLKHKAEINPLNERQQTPLDGVSGEWSDTIAGIVRFVANLLKVEVDLKQVQAARPKIAELLRQHGGKLATELK